MLEARRGDVLARLRTKAQGVRAAATGRAATVGDDAAIGESHSEMDLALMQMESETLRHIDAALERLAQGRYGDCFACGGPIAQARLTALPFAMRCRSCEEAREHAARQSPAERRSSTRGPELLDAVV
jgi:DnaK suppressor protein